MEAAAMDRYFPSPFTIVVLGRGDDIISAGDAADTVAVLVEEDKRLMICGNQLPITGNQLPTNQLPTTKHRQPNTDHQQHTTETITMNLVLHNV